MGGFNIPQGQDMGQAMMSDPSTRKRLLQAVMGSDPSSTMDPPQNDRTADDLTRHPQGMEPGSTEDLESQASSGRASLLQQMRSQNEAQPPSHLDQLQSQYDQLGQQLNAPPEKLPLWRKLVGGALAGPQTGGILRQRQQGQEFQQNQLRERQNSLQQQMEAERRQQEEQSRLDQSQEFQERMANQGRQYQASQAAPHTMDTGQGPIQYDPASRQWSPVSVGGQPVGPKAQPKPDTPEQQFFDSPEEAGKPLRQRIADYAAASQKPEQAQRPPQQLAITPDNQVIDLKPGMTVAPGTQTFQGRIKAEQGEEGKTTATNYANDYLQRGMFTGPGDEALMEKFFEMAKPTSGFRMTEAQMAMLRNAQGWVNSLQSKVRHATVGTYFSDDQRKQIVDTMNQLGQAQPGAAGKQGAAQSGGGPPGPDKPGMKWQHRTTNGKTEWRQVPQ